MKKKNIKKSTIFAMVVAMIFVVASLGFVLVGCSSNYSFNEEDFLLTITADKIEVRAYDTITVTATLKNISDRSIPIMAMMDPGGFGYSTSETITTIRREENGSIEDAMRVRIFRYNCNRTVTNAVSRSFVSTRLASNSQISVSQSFIINQVMCRCGEDFCESTCEYNCFDICLFKTFDIRAYMQIGRGRLTRRQRVNLDRSREAFNNAARINLASNTITFNITKD